MAEANAAKKPCVLIGTHDGTFHCDEALAVYLLKKLPAYKEAKVVRTRDPKKLEDCDIVVDVGAVYDPSRHRYDHHQREFDGTMASLGDINFTTKLSSAGLTYLHFGREVLKHMLPKVSDADRETLYKTMYENFMEEIDAIDNGVAQYAAGTPRYKINSTVSNRVGRLNPSWLEEDSADMDARFEMASRLVGGEFEEVLLSYANSWLPARDVVAKALERRHEVDPSGEILAFDQSCPWKAHLFELEKDQSIKDEIKYVLFPDQSGKWRVMAVPVQPGSFASRKALPEPWRGIRDEELSKKADIPGCVFVHASGFIGGTATYEGALAMAQKSLHF